MSQELKAIDGVVDADVSYDDQRAAVRYDPEQVTPQELIDAVNETGFKATLPDDTESL